MSVYQKANFMIRRTNASVIFARVSSKISLSHPTIHLVPIGPEVVKIDANVIIVAKGTTAIQLILSWTYIHVFVLIYLQESCKEYIFLQLG